MFKMFCIAGNAPVQAIMKPVNLAATDADLLYMSVPYAGSVGVVAAKVDPEVIETITMNGTDYNFPKGEWVPRPLTNAELKLQGVEIDGVMCSATATDQFGLTGMYIYVKTGGNSTVFQFENGNELLLTPVNFDAFYATWAAFRQQFFATE